MPAWPTIVWPFSNTFAPGTQHTGSRHRPQVMRGVGDTLVDLGGDLLNGTFALGEDVDDLRSPATAQRLGHLGERIEQGILRCPISHADPPIRQYSNYYLNIGLATDMFKQSFDQASSEVA